MATNPDKQALTGVDRIAAGGFLSGQQAGYGDPTATYSQQVKARKSNPFSSVFNTGLSVLSRGAQLAPRYFDSLRQQGAASGAAGDSGAKLGVDLLAAQPRAILHSLSGLSDLKGTNDIGVTQGVTGHAANTPVQKLADLAGAIGLDPTTYVGLGLVGDAGKAAKAAVASEHGTAAAAQLAKVGTQGLSDIGKAKVAATIADAAKSPTLLGDKGLGKLVRQATGRSVRSGEAKFLQDATKQLAQPSGVTFAGKTILSGSTAGALAKAAKLDQAGNAIKDTSVINGLRKLTTPRLEIAQQLGKTAEAGANTARSRGLAVSSALDAADLAHVKAAIAPTNLVGKLTGGLAGGTNISKEANAAISDALDTGQIPQLVQHFNSTGQEAAARYAQALDDVRHASTQRYIASGLADASKLHDTNTYAYRIPTTAGAKFLKNNGAAARKLFAYDPQTVSGVLSNSGPQLRNIPDLPISQVIKLMKDKTGVAKFFEADPAKRILGRAAQINQHIGEVTHLRELSNIVVDGKPLAIISNAEADSANTLKALTTNYKQTLKALDAEIGKAMTAAGHESGITTGIRKGLSELDSAANRQAGNVARTAQALAKLSDTRSALAAGADAASAAGTAGVTDKIAAADAALRGAKEVLNSFRNTPTISKALIESATKDASDARRALQLAKSTERARAGSRTVQQKIGAARAYSAAASRLEKSLQTIQRGHQAELDKITNSADKLFNAVPDGAKQRVAALRAERSALFQSFKSQKQTLREASKVAVPDGYVKIKSGPFGNTFMPQAIANDVLKLSKAVNDDADVALLSKSATAMTAAWRNLALNTAVLSLGTAARNAGTDITMMVVRGGFKDPGSYKPAGAVIKRALAAEKAGKHVNSIVHDKTLSPWERRLARELIKEGVINTGIFNTDVARAGLAATKGQKIKQLANLAGRGSIVTKHLGQANEIISNTNRAALFADVLARTGDSALAARTVRETMIDYTDLTQYEKGAKRWLIPFYTFASRNFTNAVWGVAHTPGRVLTVEKIRQAFYGQNDPSGPVPDYTLANDQRPFLNVGGTDILSNQQSPLQAAAQVVQPLADVASTLPIPGVHKTEGGFKSAAGGALQNVGGFEGSAAKNAAQEATGTNLFTGSPLNPTQSPWERVLQSLIPSEQKGKTTAKNLTSDDKAKQTAQLLSLLGVGSTANNDAAQTSEQYRRIRELGATAKEQGIPTATELRKTGKLAPAPKRKSTKKLYTSKKPTKKLYTNKKTTK